MYKRVIKRALDILLSVIGIVLLALPMLVVAVAIKLDTPGPVFFCQRRVGIHKKEFTIIKLRTMRTDAPHESAPAVLDVEAVRFTKLQLFLRSTSIDELPQLINILLGDMSVVGPRPSLWNEFELIAEREKYHVYDVLPGLTGWAQVNGRDELTIDVKARFDGEYVDKLSFAMDAKCFFMTIGKVLRRDGVIEGGTDALQEEQKETVEVTAE